MPEASISSLPLRAPRATPEFMGNALLIGAAIMMVAGVPSLYGLGAMSITTVNQLGRFLAVVVAAIGLDLVWGYTGILSLCQAMFFCLGGYAIGMHMALHGPLDGDGIPRCLYVVSSDVGGFQLPWFWRPFGTLPIAAIIALFIPGILAFVFGYYTFRSRVRGVYLSIITQATTLAATYVFRMNNMRLCGTNGLTNFVTLAGFDLQAPSTKIGLYTVTAIVLVCTYLTALWIVKSRLGRVLIAIRDNESRLRFAGYQPVTFKVFVFVVGAIAAALGGMLYTPQNGIITPFKMEALESIYIVAYVAVGGRGTLSGAVVGTLVVNYLYSLLTSGVFYSWLPLFLRMPEGQNPLAGSENAVMHAIRTTLKIVLGAEGWLFILGGVFILVTLVFPDGIVGAWRRMLAHAFGKSSSGSALSETPAPALERAEATA